MDIRFDVREVTAFLGSFPRNVETALARAQTAEVGPFLIRTAQAVTDEEDAKASGRYRAGFRYERIGPTTWALVNVEDHAPFVEFGRRAGAFPPRSAILSWMQERGIPERAAFPIMRAIARRGTVKRKGYRGFGVFAQTTERAGDEVFRITDAAYQRAMRQ